MTKKIQTLVLLTMLSTLVSCGFSLRSSENFSAQLPTLGLNLQQGQSEFSQLLSDALQNAGVTVTSSEPQLLLSISDEQLNSRPITVDPSARAAQYELNLSINIQLTQGDEFILAPQTLSVTKSYFQDIENLSGAQEEVEIISNEMRSELVNQLMRRLQSISLSTN